MPFLTIENTKERREDRSRRENLNPLLAERGSAKTFSLSGAFGSHARLIVFMTRMLFWNSFLCCGIEIPRRIFNSDICFTQNRALNLYNFFLFRS